MLKKQQIFSVALGVFILILVSTIWIFHSLKESASIPAAPLPAVSKPAPTPSQTSTADPTLSPTPYPSLESGKFSEIGSEQDHIAFAQTVTDVPYNYDTMVSAAVIRLDSDPRLEGTDIITHVILRDETFTIFFKEAPDQESVKSALLRMNAEQTNRFYPKLLMHWTSDRQLHVKIIPNKTEKWDNYLAGYALDLSGTKTATGVPFDQTDGNIRFFAIMNTPSQLWRYSLDGESKEKLTDFTEPYAIQPLDDTNAHLLLSRPAHYCACDALYPLFFSVYNIDTNQLQPYPFEIQLTRNYRGNGSFMADTRGFFFDQPKPGIKAPHTDTARFIQMPDFIYGASFSTTHEHLIMAVGKEEQTGDYDLVILSLKSNTQLRYSKVIKGNIPEDQAYGRILPFTFKDDGERVYFTATDGASHQDLNYYYDWKGKKVVPWNVPKEIKGWTGFTESSDKIYRLYANGGLFKADHFVKNSLELLSFNDGIWIPDTHRYMVNMYRDSHKLIDIMDADTLKMTSFVQNISSQLYSVSSDGKWVTLVIQDKDFAAAP